MSTRLILVLAALLAVLAASGTPARAADEPIDALLKDFRNLHTSLRNNNGIRTENLPVVNAFRERVLDLLDEHPRDERLLALDLQLSIWLKEEDQIDAGYEALINAATTPEKLSQYALAWVASVRKEGDPARVNEVYEELIARLPDNVDLRLDWSRQLRLNGEFARTIDVLMDTDFDPAEHPKAIVTLCEAQMAEHQFEEALASLDRIPAEVLEADRAMSSRVDVRRKQAEALIADWAKEQEIRSAEAEKDDLPRAEMITTKGDIVLELFEDQAPNTVANFIELAEKGFWYNTQFYNVLQGTYVLGGDPIARPGLDAGDLGRPGGSNPGYYIPDEHGRPDIRKHFAGTLGMSHGSKENSGGCLFYMTLRPTPERDGRYTAFGRVIEGMDVLRSLEKDDVLVNVKITRQRDHAYEVTKLPTKPGDPPAATPAPAPGAEAPAVKTPG